MTITDLNCSEIDLRYTSWRDASQGHTSNSTPSSSRSGMKCYNNSKVKLFRFWPYTDSPCVFWNEMIRNDLEFLPTRYPYCDVSHVRSLNVATEKLCMGLVNTALEKPTNHHWSPFHLLQFTYKYSNSLSFKLLQHLQIFRKNLVNSSLSLPFFYVHFFAILP